MHTKYAHTGLSVDNKSDLTPGLSQPAVDALEASQPVFDGCGGFLVMWAAAVINNYD